MTTIETTARLEIERLDGAGPSWQEEQLYALRDRFQLLWGNRKGRGIAKQMWEEYQSGDFQPKMWHKLYQIHAEILKGARYKSNGMEVLENVRP